MGVASSKIKDDKVLVLCQERKRFLREALDGRCALATAHYDYIVSLRDTGSLLRKCFEGEEGPADEKEGDFAESKYDFDSPSTETVVHVSENRNDVSVENTSTEQAPAHHASESVVSEHTDSLCDRPKNERRVIKDFSSSMKEIEILFFRESDSGKLVSRILEEAAIQFRPLLPEEIAHGSNASNFLATSLTCCRDDVPVPEPPPQAEIKYLTWHRSVSSQLSPSRYPVGTIPDIHTSTLDRLYAWETKLYDEVKASSAICRRYDEKCKQLGDQEWRGKNQINIDFTRASVKDLHSRILVAIQKIDFISKNIEDLRDKELQPQLDELIRSLTRMWAAMLDCHRRQHAIIKFISSRCNVKVSFESESQCQAALVLLVELSKLCSNFQNWMASHKAYLCSLNLWLHKCMKPLKKRKSSRKQNLVDVSLTECAVKPIFTTSEIWMKLLDDLPTKDLEEGIAGLIADVSSHLPRHSDPRPDQRLTGEMGAEILRNYATVDIQSSLMTFIEKSISDG